MLNDMKIIKDNRCTLKNINIEIQSDRVGQRVRENATLSVFKSKFKKYKDRMKNLK